MRKNGQEIRSRTDYILGIDRILFQDVAVRDMRHQSDHYMVLGCLRGEPAREITGYLRKSRRFSLQPLRCGLVLMLDKLFSEIKTHTPQPPLRERVGRACIYDKTWSAIDARVTACREGDQRTVRQLSQ